MFEILSFKEGEIMNKTKMGTQQLLNPKPVVVVGTFLDDKPNFITVSWIGNTSSNPATIAIAIRDIRYSLKGILNNKTFSVNIPSEELINETDYCGSVSGLDYNKVEECKFKIFFGNLNNAPLIEQCPINIECEVFKIVKIGDHSLIIGKIIETYISDDCFTNGIPDVRKINPMSFCTLSPESMGYYKVGDFIGDTSSITG